MNRTERRSRRWRRRVPCTYDQNLEVGTLETNGGTADLGGNTIEISSALVVQSNTTTISSAQTTLAGESGRILEINLQGGTLQYDGALETELVNANGGALDLSDSTLTITDGGAVNINSDTDLSNTTYVGAESLVTLDAVLTYDQGLAIGKLDVNPGGDVSLGGNTLTVADGSDATATGAVTIAGSAALTHDGDLNAESFNIEDDGSFTIRGANTVTVEAGGITNTGTMPASTITIDGVDGSGTQNPTFVFNDVMGDLDAGNLRFVNTGGITTATYPVGSIDTYVADTGSDLATDPTVDPGSNLTVQGGGTATIDHDMADVLVQGGGSTLTVGGSNPTVTSITQTGGTINVANNSITTDTLTVTGGTYNSGTATTTVNNQMNLDLAAGTTTYDVTAGPSVDVEGSDLLTANNVVLNNAGTVLTISAPTATGGPTFYVDASLDDGGNRWDDRISGNPTGLDFQLVDATAFTSTTSSKSFITGAVEFVGGATDNNEGALLSLTGNGTASFQDSNTVDPGGVDDSQQDVTLEVWFKPDSLTPGTTNGQIIFEDGGGTGFGFFVNNNELQLRRANNTGIVSYDLSTDPSGLLLAAATDEFIQAVGTYDVNSGIMELFVNGSSVGTDNPSGGDWTGGDDAAIGTRGGNNTGGIGGGQSNTESFDGQVAIFRAFNGTILGEEDVARLFEFNSLGNFVDISETSLDIAETGEVNIASSDPVILGGLNLADGVTLTLDEDGSAGRVSFNGEISVGDSPGTGMIDNIGGSAFGLADGVVINWEKIGTSTDLLHILGDLELSDGFGNISTGTIAVSGGGILDAKEIIIQVDGDTLGVPGQPFELTNWTVTGAPGYTAGIDAEGNLVITGEVIPEPSSIAIAVLAAVGCCFAYRRRKNA